MPQCEVLRVAVGLLDAIGVILFRTRSPGVLVENRSSGPLSAAQDDVDLLGIVLADGGGCASIVAGPEPFWMRFRRSDPAVRDVMS